MIHVEGISKRYQLGETRHDTLRDTLAHRIKSVVSGNTEAAKTHADTNHFWALKDVSFDVAEGEVMAIVGRNGAGKSTLLKILSRITPPTEGQIRLKGRVASLLEVGTGFHQELTGRENVFMNGAILGMGRAEIKRKFDEIVAFSEVEKFIDTPVKFYSSGMYVRLAFAVAAHLEPEILVVDEVLAVGDAAFQAKCLGKMSEVARGGRTVLFVSHNMAGVQSLCDSAVLLEQGKMITKGGVVQVIEHYFHMIGEKSAVPVMERTDRDGSGSVLFTDVTVETNGREGTEFVCGASVVFKLKYAGGAKESRKSIRVGVYDMMSTCAWFFDSAATGDLPETLPGSGELQIRVGDGVSLTPGAYNVNIALFDGIEMADYIQSAITLTVTEGDFYGTGRLPAGKPVLLVQHQWSFAETAQ